MRSQVVRYRATVLATRSFLFYQSNHQTRHLGTLEHLLQNAAGRHLAGSIEYPQALGCYPVNPSSLWGTRDNLPHSPFRQKNKNPRDDHQHAYLLKQLYWPHSTLLWLFHEDCRWTNKHKYVGWCVRSVWTALHRYTELYM